MVPKKAVKNAKIPSRLPPQMCWEKLGGEYLITNDSGHHAWLRSGNFKKLLDGCLAEGTALYSELSDKGFISDRMDFEALAAKWRKKHDYLRRGPSLHILVLTLRCNHKCLYCQSSAAGIGASKADMTLATARRSVDFAFSSPSAEITLEFQGGEPLLNWDVLKGTVVYARKKARAADKTLRLALVSNFSLMTAEKAQFLLANEVSICTSLDGPADLHNRVRRYSSGNSHGDTVKWLRHFRKRYAGQGGEGYRIFKSGALLTVSAASLGRYRDIIDEYVRLGMEDIFMRPVAPIGYAKKMWDKIGYTPEEFSIFYGRSLDYIIDLNRRGTVIREKTACMMLEKILNLRDPGYLDARCPCGAGIGQIAYDYNGDIYTCDEGRMVGWQGDTLFRMGNVYRDSYKKALTGAASRACVVSSNLESQPVCSRCVYKPYCGVCPVCNYETQGSPWGDVRVNERCRVLKGILTTVFSRLKAPKSRAILEKWVEKR